VALEQPSSVAAAVEEVAKLASELTQRIRDLGRSEPYGTMNTAQVLLHARESEAKMGRTRRDLER
jgi:hypothetical protein